MSTKTILITGGTGYIGGELLFQLNESGFTRSHRLLGTYRNPAHAEELRNLGVEPVQVDLEAEGGAKLKEFVLEHKLDGIVNASDAYGALYWLPAIEALGSLGPGRFFLGTSGMKLFSSLVGFDQSQTIYDDANPLDAPMATEPLLDALAVAHQNYRKLFSTAEAAGVKFQLLAPPMVYGISRTFGNPISIQIVEMVRIANSLGRIPSLPLSSPYTMCHVIDCADLYAVLMNNPSAPAGVYFADGDTFTWEELAEGLLQGLGMDSEVKPAQEGELAAAAKALGHEGNENMVIVLCGGKTNVFGRGSRSAGWKPTHTVEHLYKTAPEEARYIAERL